MHRMLALSALALLAMTAAEARPITQRDLATLDRISEPRISPDGRWIIYDLATTDFAANKRTHAIWRVATDGKSEPVKIANGTAARFAPDGSRVFYLADGKDTTQVFSINPDARCIRAPCDVAAPLQATDLPLEVGSYRISPDGHTLVVSMAVFPDKDDPAATKARMDDKAKTKASGAVYDRIFIRHWDTWSDGTQNHLFALKLGADGRAKSAVPLMSSFDGDVPSKPFGDDGDYAIAPDSRSVLFSARVAGKSEPWNTNFDVFEVRADGSKAAQNRTASNPAWDTAPAFSPDGERMAYRAMKRAGFEADRYGIYVSEGGAPAREIDPRWDRSADKIAWSGDGTVVYALAEDVGQTRLFAIDVATGAAQALTGNGHITHFDVAHAAGGDVVVYARDGLDSPSQLFVLRPGQRAAQITRANADKLDAVEFSPFEQFSFTGWNNETVHGYVVKPHGWQAGRKYPTVLLIHGGPQRSFGDGWSYRWNPQVWAGWGYGVVVIDFHGSTGYGQAFTDSISSHWGDRPLEDLKKGWTAAQAKYSWIDSSRACAAGASYGGYMVNWMAGKWQQPWQCLISHDGIFDNRMMGYATEELWFSEWENGQATVWERPGNYERFNPVNHVASWTKPMLVIHSANDFRIPIEQGIAAFTALQRKGIESKFLTFPNENHWVLKPQNSVQWHDTVEAWLKRWIGGGAP